MQDNQKLVAQIGELLKQAAELAIFLALFIVIIVLMMLVALLKILPALLRIVSIIAWLAAVVFVFIALWRLNILINPVDWIGNVLISLEYSAIILFIPSLFEQDDKVWGGYFLAALAGLGLILTANWLDGQSQYYLVVRLVPVALSVAALLAYLTSGNRTTSVEEDSNG